MQNSVDKRFATWAWAGAGVAVIVFAVVALTAFGGARFWTDGKEIRTPAASAPLRRILWLPAKPVAGVSDADQYEPKVSADGLTMVFVRRRAGSNADLFEARWTPAGWGEATAIGAINTEKDELGPELSRDGTELYFYSDRAGGLGGFDLWVSKQVDGAWGEARNLGPAVNSGANEYGPALSVDGKVLSFASNRLRAGEPVRDADNWPATMREKRERHDYDLYSARSDNAGTWGSAEAIAALNTEFDEGAPATSPAGDFLYFASDRPGGLGGFDVYRSRLLRDGVGEVENLGGAVNSEENDLDPGLSADGFRLYFSSDRASDAGVPRYSLWSTASREVYVEVESANRLARLWEMIVPLLPWIGALLLALIPLALLWWMLKNELWRRRLGRLSLLAQCVLISMLIHALITAGLAVWKVGSGIAEAVRSGGGTRVILTSSSGGVDDGGGVGGIAAQLGAPATSIAFEAPPLAKVGVVRPLEAVIDAPAAIELPRGREVEQERMAIRSEASDEVTPSELRAPEAPVPTVVASVPASERQTRASEAGLEPMRAAETGGAAPVAMTALHAPEVSMPEALPRQAERLDAAVSIATESALGSTRGSDRELSASGVLPSDASLESWGARLPQTRGVVASEEARSAPAGVMSGLVKAPSPSFALRAPGAPGPMPALAGREEHARLGGALIGTELSASTRELGSVAKEGAVGAQEQEVSARLPAMAAPSVTGETAGSENGARTPNGLATRASAPVGFSGPKLEASGTIALPAGASQVKSERLSVGGFGASETPATGLGGSAFGGGLLGTSLAGLGASPLPADISEPVQPLDRQEQRQPEMRGEMLAKMGGSAETERAVGRALEWFARHQEADGRWSGKNFDGSCGGCAAPAEIEADAAMTGIVLLCYLGAGHTHMADGPYRERIERAIRWLVDRQASSGDMRRGETMYGQTLSTVALCEALAMTKDQRLAAPTRRAVNFVLKTAAAGGAKREEDTSVLGWLVMTVESARRAGIAVPRDVFDAAGRWLDGASSTGAPGHYSYVRNGPASAAMTAEAMFVQQILGHSRDEARMKESAAFILREMPKWDGAAPTYHWYYATLALFEQQGEAWEQWNRALSPILVENQRKDGRAAGSWDPQDEWSRLGGRLYQTAVCTLSLEVYYRYKAR